MPCIVKKTFETAHDAGCHLIAQVKANQPGLLERVEQICQSDTPTEAVASRDYGRCRQETRTVLVFDAQNHFAGTEWQPHIAAVVQVTRDRLERNAATGLWRPTDDAVSYYVCDIRLSADDAATAIRAHWGIENRSHYVRDTALDEDASRIRKNAGVFARLRSFACNILRANGVDNVKDARFRNACGGINHLSRYRFS
jgi:predicted transposase YbfD/YdcC